MQVMLKLALLGWLVLGACASKPGAYDEVLAEMQQLEARMCACADRACRQAVFDDLLAFRTSLPSRLEGKPPPTDAQTRRGREIEARLRACRRAAGEGEGRGEPDEGDEGDEGDEAATRR